MDIELSTIQLQGQFNFAKNVNTAIFFNTRIGISLLKSPKMNKQNNIVTILYAYYYMFVRSYINDQTPKIPI